MRMRPGAASAAVIAAAFAIYIVAAASASAHLAAATAGGWSDGLAHPFSGIDHLLAMIAVGVWAVQLGGRAMWLLPLTFPLFMAIGGGLGLAGVALPGAEDGVALSVAVLGVVLAVAARPPLAIGMATVGAFGLVHGNAHGATMPEAAAPMLYALGFMAGTVLLHAIGVALGLITRSPFGQRLLPIGAAAVAGIGITLVLAL